jgi:teichuronic acid biosynthesis glycosyltransferase TuaG
MRHIFCNLTESERQLTAFPQSTEIFKFGLRGAFMSGPSRSQSFTLREDENASDSTRVTHDVLESSPLNTLEQLATVVSNEIAPYPLVTVIIPTYNRAAVIRKALDTALNQTYRNLEILVVDDGSTDETAQVLSEYQNRIRYIYQSNQGPSAARNRAITEAQGKYIAFLDSDDEWLPTKLEKQIAFLESHPDLSFVACLSTNERKAYSVYQEPGPQFLKFLRQPFKPNVSRYVVHRECFEQLGLFDTSIHGPEDWEMWLRLLQDGRRFGFVAEPLMVYTFSEDSISRRPIEMLAGESIIRQRYVDTLPKTWERWRLSAWFTSRSYMNAAFCYREQGELGKSARYMLGSILLSPLGPRNKVRLSAFLFTILLILSRIVRRRPAAR